MKGGTLIRSANNQDWMSSKAVIIQPPVLRELRVNSMLGIVETPKDQTTVREFLVLKWIDEEAGKSSGRIQRTRLGRDNVFRDCRAIFDSVS
jgi:hypothetical protein